MPSRDKRLPLDTWNLSEPQGNIFGNPRPRPVFDSSQTPYQGTVHSTTPSATGAVPVQVSTGQPVARGEERIESTEFYGWTAKTADIGASVRKMSTFQCLETSFKTQISSCSDVPSEAMWWIKEVEMVDSVDELKSSRSIAGKDFPNFELLDARIASALNKTIRNSHFKKDGKSGETESPERGLVPSRKTDRLHDLRLLLRVTGVHDNVLDYADLFSSLYASTMFGTSKPCLNCTTWKFIRRYRCPIVRS